MKVVLTEKPSVARDIARVLRVAGRRDGYFEGSGYIVTWALGHLIRLSDPEKYDPALKQWSLDTLPIVPPVFKIDVQPDSSIRAQYQIIKTLLTDSKTKEVICATDAGREGELIFRHIYVLSGCKAPVKRLWISSQTDSAIKEGFEALKPGLDYYSLYQSALSRSEADWLIGINATRAYSLKFSHGQGVMSVGRVQTPVLKLIVDRHREVENFKPETYYEISADLNHANGDYVGLWVNKKGESRLKDKEKAEAIAARLRALKQGEIASMLTKQFSENPPLLYDLTELQKDANRLFKFSADRTLKIAQRLYEHHKVLTYPRTSSRYLSGDLKAKLPRLIKQVSTLDEYHVYAQALIDTPPKLGKRLINDEKVTDHHAIIPTDKMATPSQLSPDERKIYDRVIRRFLASMMPACQKESTTLTTALGQDMLRSTGVVITEPGWRWVYSTDQPEKPKKGASEAPVLLPKVKKGDSVTQKKIHLQRKQSKAPPLYTEAGILAAMETAGKHIDDDDARQAMKDCGLGTPATRAQILERLIAVNYIVREKNKLIPTEKGKQLVTCIQDDALLSANLTGQWEKKLNDIVTGKYKRSTYMQEIRDFAKQIIKNVNNAKTPTPPPPENALGSCPLCDGSIVENKSAYSCTQWKANNCRFVIWKEIAKKRISAQMAKTLLKEGKSKLLKGFKSKKGTSFDAALKLDKGRVVFDFQP